MRVIKYSFLFMFTFTVAMASVESGTYSSFMESKINEIKKTNNKLERHKKILVIKKELSDLEKSVSAKDSEEKLNYIYGLSNFMSFYSENVKTCNMAKLHLLSSLQIKGDQDKVIDSFPQGQVQAIRQTLEIFNLICD